jgi:hypothetical protein
MAFSTSYGPVFKWRYLPHDFPPASAVFHHFGKWRWDSTWERINGVLREHERRTPAQADCCRLRTARAPRPPPGEGYDGEKKVPGRCPPGLGSAVWRQAATQFGISGALLVAAVGALIAIPLTWRARLQQGAAMDLSPSMHWPQSIASEGVQHDCGPVMTMIEYKVDPTEAPAFLATLRELSRARRRSGAYAWGVVEDAARPGRFIEYFMEPSWLEHLRHHERVTEADKQIQERLREFHQGNERPQVSHFLVPETSQSAASATSAGASKSWDIS